MVLVADLAFASAAAGLPRVLMRETVGAVLINKHCSEALLGCESQEALAFPQRMHSSAHSTTEGVDTGGTVVLGGLARWHFELRERKKEEKIEVFAYSGH